MSEERPTEGNRARRRGEGHGRDVTGREGEGDEKGRRRQDAWGRGARAARTARTGPEGGEKGPGRAADHTGTET